MAEKKEEPKKKPTGWSGTTMYHGRVLDRQKPYACSKREWAALAEEMYSSNPHVRTVIRAMLDTMLSSRFYWAPGNEDDPLSVTLADQMNKNMGLNGYGGRMKRSFERILRQVLLFVPVGFRYFELQWEFNEVEGIWDLVDMKDRKPSAHDQWVLNGMEELGIPDGELQGVVQKPASGDASPENSTRPFISAWDLLLFVFEQEGDDYDGQGLLRAVERSYHRYNEAELKIQAFNRSRSAVVIEIQDRESVLSSGCELPDMMTQVQDVRTSSKLFQEGMAAFIETWPGVRVNGSLVLDHQPEKAMAIRAEAANEILLVGFVQFLQLGTTDTGSRAVGEVHESFFRRSCINLLDYVCSVFNGEWMPGRGLAGQYAYLNAPEASVDSSSLPVLVHEGLQVDPRLENIDKILSAFTSGLIGKSGVDEDELRDLFGLKRASVSGDDSLIGDQTDGGE